MNDFEKNKYMYFMYSSEHVNQKNNIESGIGRKFECGTVVINGTKKKFSFMSTDKRFLHMYPDAVLIAEGELSKIQYTEPYTEAKRGN